MGQSLPPERIKAALGAIATWRTVPDVAVMCPVCGTAGLTIADRSARPYAEWYELNCPACGLDHTLHIPLAPLAP